MRSNALYDGYLYKRLVKLSVVVGFVVGLGGLMSGCGSEDTAQTGLTPCTFDNDCELGEVCGTEGECISVPCRHCANNPDQICYKTEENPEGTCSTPECHTNEDCDKEGEECIDKQCQSGCTSNADCEGDKKCNAFGKCIEATEDPVEPDAGSTDDVGNDADETGCDEGSCPTGQHCDLQTRGCVDDCTPGSCAEGESCNQNTGLCESESTGEGSCEAGESNGCPSGANEDADLWHTEWQACVECCSDDHCDGDSTCNSNGQCTSPCETSCDPNRPGGAQCGDKTNGEREYCISDCCVECIGAADCAEDEVCVQGQCEGSPNDCTANPNLCGEGQECNQQTGECESTAGGNCTPSDPNSCPQGTFCDPNSQQCTSLGGGMGCGLCDSSCSCPGTSTKCDQQTIGLPFCSTCNQDSDCPSGQTCRKGFAAVAAASLLGLPPTTTFCF